MFWFEQQTFSLEGDGYQTDAWRGPQTELSTLPDTLWCRAVELNLLRCLIRNVLELYKYKIGGFVLDGAEYYRLESFKGLKGSGFANRGFLILQHRHSG